MPVSPNTRSSAHWSGWVARICLGCILSVVGLFVFEFGCYVPAGKAFKDTAGIAGGKRWEVWFRKNKDSGEPFTARLFIERTPEQWYLYQLVFVALRCPCYRIQAQGDHFVVLEGSSPLATLDEALGHFHRIGRDEPEAADVTFGPPPGRGGW